MSKRRGDWRDLLTTYALALKPNKIYVGYLAVLYTLFVMVVAIFVYGLLVQGGLVHPAKHWVGYPRLAEEGGVFGLLAQAWRGGGRAVIKSFLPLLNPFYDASVPHFVLSVLTYIALFWAWSGTGGMISRLTAMEYARDDLPTLSDARQMVRSKRSAYWLAPVWPLLFLVGLVFLNFLGGLIASIPYAGPILLVIPGFPLLFITSILIVMLILFGVLSFGLMMPAVSVGGKDALDGWSTSYTYVLWGSARYIGYTALACAIGTASVYVAAKLTHLLLYVFTNSVDLGYIVSTPWLTHAGLKASTVGGYTGFMQCIMGLLLLGIRALPYAYAFSFFFSAFTVIFFLLRKHVDNIEIEEIYEEAEEEEEFLPEEGPAPAPEEPAQEEAEEAPPEVAEEGKPEPSQTSEDLPAEPKVDEDKSMED